MARYSDIRRAAQLKASLDRYTTYLSTPRTPDLNSRGDRAVQVSAGVIPFSLDIAGDMVATSAPQTGETRLKTAINAISGAKVFTGAEVTGDVDSLNAFKPARVTTFENATKTKTIATSDVTGARYLKYAGDRFSLPFGKDTKAGTEKLVDVFDAIKAALKARQNLDVNRVSVVPERYSY